MDFLFKVDWHELFTPRFSILEMVIRGVAVYLGLVLLLRVVLKRQAGKVSLSDLLVVTIVGGVCRNPMIADSYSLPDGLGVIVSVLGCSYAIDWLSYRSPFIHRLVHPHPVLLIRDGAVFHEHLEQELMTMQQLHSKLRSHGIVDPKEVGEAWLEGNGHVSVVLKEHAHLQSTGAEEISARN